LTAASLLYTPEGRLRAPYRLGAFLLAAVVGVLVAQTVAYPLASTLGRLLGARVSAEAWLAALGLLLAHWLVLHVVEREPAARRGFDGASRGWRFVALHREAARPPLLALGMVLGALAIALPVGALLLAGWLRVEPAAGGSSWETAWRYTLLLVPAALAEELAFRGYAFAVLRESAGDAAALLSTSLLFGLIHFSNPGADVRSITLVVLAGLFLGGVVLATGSLYAAWLAHLAWNWTLGVGFHTAVSGLPFAAPDYRTVDAGPDWATGGVWGPEGGAAAALGMGAAVLCLRLWRARLAGAAAPIESRRARGGGAAGSQRDE
jgi:membrane protease YdiL (CAAX protease family)